MIISPFHMGAHQLNCLGDFLPAWMIRVLQLTLTWAAGSNSPPPSGRFLLQSPAPYGLNKGRDIALTYLSLRIIISH